MDTITNMDIRDSLGMINSNVSIFRNYLASEWITPKKGCAQGAHPFFENSPVWLSNYKFSAWFKIVNE